MSRLAYVLPLAILIAGCKPTVPPPEHEAATRTETAELRAQTTASTPGPDASSDSITMRYRCEQGHRVDIVGGDSARVTLADGRVVDIPRVADSAPPRYSGIALSFEVSSDGATLGQDEVGGFACREAD
jgi:membrane-bound inhibitor of C-type lysozyme